MQPLIVANWKMQLADGDVRALAEELRALDLHGVDLVVCPSFTALVVVREKLVGSAIALGAQDCAWEERGALTGAVSPADLVALGCSHVIIGHSERRQQFGETDAMIAQKLRAALAVELRPILCVGETAEEWKRGQREAVITRQLQGAFGACDVTFTKPLIIAYEPVWAIGSGHAANPTDAVNAAQHIAKTLLDICGRTQRYDLRVLYGGSVDATNVRAFLDADGIAGVLVGSASQSVGRLRDLLAAMRE